METVRANTTKNNILDKLQFGEKQISDYKEIADILNKHFMSIGETTVAKNSYNSSNTKKKNLNYTYILLAQIF